MGEGEDGVHEVVFDVCAECQQCRRLEPLLIHATIPPPVESILGWSVGRIPRFGTSTATSACLPARPTAGGGTGH